MNLKTFEELISDPERLNKDTLSELEQLLKEYPFCQTFHLLYTKNLYLLKHIRYHQQLKVAAAIVGDRTRLKHYIEGFPQTFSVEDEHPKVHVEIPVEPKIEIEEETIDQPVRLENLEVNPVEWDADYESVLSASINVEVSREERKKAIIELINKKFNERLAASANKPDDAFQATDIPLIVKTEDDSKEEPAVEEKVESMNEIVSTLETKEVIPSTDLIEKFLRDAPRMPRPRKEFYNPVNLAARSIEENEDFYTETYAYICLKQGNAVKAIKIYDKLSLKFPEKSSYFAGLIEKIKKEHNI